MKLTTNIFRHEVACRCQKCDCETLDVQTALIVQDCADHFADELGHRVVVDINSGHRCKFWNQHEGGAKNSFHLLGQALDFSIRGVSPKQIYGYLDSQFPNTLGLGLYKSFVHVDSRARKARWQG